MNTRPAITLAPIELDGALRALREPPPELVCEVARATAELYQRVGFEPPWIGYLALADDELVGTCGFKSPPRDGRVEIAYFTFLPFEGRGIATAMAAELVRLAHGHPESPQVFAQTLPQRNASHRVLERLGFRHTATLEHADDGVVWEWELPHAPHDAP